MNDKYEVTERLARNPRRARREADLSREALERRATLSRVHVGRPKRGGIECRATTVFRRIAALG